MRVVELIGCAARRRDYALLSVLPRRVQRSLVVAQWVGAATLLRSIAYDRWITVLAAALLIAGTLAAQRGRTWGVALAFALSAWFALAVVVGIAPVWFFVVALAAARPFALLWRSFSRSDRGATSLLAGLAVAGGAAVAVGWKALAWTLFTTIPALQPSMDAQHGLALFATLAVMVAFARRARARAAADPERVRIQPRVRIGEVSDVPYQAADTELEEQGEPSEAGQPVLHRRGILNAPR